MPETEGVRVRVPVMPPVCVTESEMVAEPVRDPVTVTDDVIEGVRETVAEGL